MMTAPEGRAAPTGGTPGTRTGGTPGARAGGTPETRAGGTPETRGGGTPETRGGGPQLPERQVWGALRDELVEGRPAVLAAVVSHTGSSPGRTGWLMALGRSGWLAGTTGGGVAEADIVRRGAGLLREAVPQAGLVTQTHNSGAGTPSGMLCGGEQVVALVPIPPASLPCLDAIDGALAGGDTVSWTITRTSLALGDDTGTDTGDGLTRDGDSWRYRRTSGPSHRVIVVGAGHVGRTLARLLVAAGFRVEVVDERPGAAGRLAGIAHRVTEARYEELPATTWPAERTFVVVATHSPERDAAAITALATVPWAYLGVLGSRSKLAHLPEPTPLIAHVGLPIGSHTPEEIAISIAAELIAVRNLGPDAFAARVTFRPRPAAPAPRPPAPA